MYINVIEAYRKIIAIADAELIGKTFSEGNKQLDIKESFYKGDIKPIEEIKELIIFGLKEDATFNLVGEKTINLALEMGIINEESVGKIENIPYAMILI
ncbi:DUF424 family protein [archaeon]|nr:DUF424 family protein [archaeon]